MIYCTQCHYPISTKEELLDHIEKCDLDPKRLVDVGLLDKKDLEELDNTQDFVYK